MTTMEERVSQMEGIVRQFATVVGNMVTREELRAAIETSEKRLLAELERTAGDLRAEIREVELRAEIRAAELRAEIRAAELRIIKWNVATIIASVAVAVAIIKLLP